MTTHLHILLPFLLPRAAALAQTTTRESVSSAGLPGYLVWAPNGPFLGFAQMSQGLAITIG